MLQKFRPFGIWSALAFVGYGLEHGQEFLKSLAIFFPHSALYMLSQHSLAVLASTGGFVVAFFFATFIGYTTGLAASTAYLAATDSKLNNSKLIGAVHKIIETLYTVIYIVPFVLTVILLQKFTHNVSFSWLKFLIFSAGAGAALGGFQIFISLYSASASKSENRKLVDSLSVANISIPQHQSITLLKGYVISSLRMRDCVIEPHCESIERAWHLSIVAVMICETLIGSFYELLWPSYGPIEEWTKGIGGLMLGGSGIDLQIVVGSIYIIYLIDWIGLELIRLFCNQKWLKFYDQSLQKTI